MKKPLKPGDRVVYKRLYPYQQSISDSYDKKGMVVSISNNQATVILENGYLITWDCTYFKRLVPKKKPVYIYKDEIEEKIWSLQEVLKDIKAFSDDIVSRVREMEDGLKEMEGLLK